MKRFFSICKRYPKLIGMVSLAFVVLASLWHRSLSPHLPVETSHVITVQAQSLNAHLYYSGTLQPAKAVAVLSPADGVIDAMAYRYGDTVKAGSLLFSLSSEKFQTDYKAALVQFVKARSEMSNNQNQLFQGQFLHKNKLISDDEFKIRQTNFYNTQLAFIQAKDALVKMSQQLNIKDVNLSNLSIANIDKINNALHQQSEQQKLLVVAPTSGVLLLPFKQDSGSNDKKIGKGEQIKQGDVLAVIGEGHGFSVRFDVNEFDIHQIKVGQQVKVTGTAFPDDVLVGTIAGVDHQAQVNSNGVPNFSAEVVIPHLTAKQQKTIYVGMSAKIEVDVDGAAEITVPLKAITEKAGEPYVQLQDAVSKKTHPALVKIGKTTADSVVVLAGVKVGDTIVVTD